MATFSIKSFRLRTICKNVFNGTLPKEGRDGDHKEKKIEKKRQSVIQFIEKLPAKESHYSRNKSKRLGYLDSSLNIKKLFKLYKNSVGADLKVSCGLFRIIFNGKFNIGFKAPTSDQ